MKPAAAGVCNTMRAFLFRLSFKKFAAVAQKPPLLIT